MSLQITVTEEPDVLYQKVSIMVKGHDRAVLDSYELFTTMAAKELGITISNVWVLIQSICYIRPLSIISFSLTWFWFSSFLCHSYEPLKDMERFTLLKSVHIFKKHRVQYEMRTHYRCIEVMSLCLFKLKVLRFLPTDQALWHWVLCAVLATYNQPFRKPVFFFFFF